MAGEGPSVWEVPNGNWDPRLRVFRHGALVDTAAVVTERYLVLIDTGPAPEPMATVMDALADVAAGRQLLVLNTHADWDHYWGNSLFAGPDVRYPAPILGHALARQRTCSPEAHAMLAELNAQHPGELAHVRLIAPTLAFTPPLLIDGGDMTLEVIAAPGHQPDHVAVWMPAIRTLWCGDAAENPWPYANDDPAALPALRASLDTLAALDAEWAFYCHAPGQTSPRVIAWNRAYFAALEAAFRVALAAGRIGPADAAETKEPDLGLPERAGFPARAALAPDQDPALLTPGYEAGHARNMRVMIAWLLG